MKNTVWGIAVSALLLTAATGPALAEGNEPPSKSLISEDVISDIRGLLDNPIVRLSIIAENEKRQGISEAEILDLDNAWRAQKSSDGPQPLIAAALGSPVSTYLLRKQAASKGLYNEIFVMDLNGLNVGQSSITSDYWQGDEDKVLKTLPKGVGTVFIDEPEYDENAGIWLAQVNLTLAAENKAIGVSTVEINLTELQRRQNMKSS